MEISNVTYFPRHTKITLRFRHQLYSAQVPGLAASLLEMLPCLREHICHNRHGREFVDELADTELGHVFEHVMLAVLHKRGICTRGQTTWDWQRDPIGLFHVTIATGKKLIIKESLLIAQTIMTNALVQPILAVTLPTGLLEQPVASKPLPVSLQAGSQKATELLFTPVEA